MASQFDESDFVDDEYQSAQAARASTSTYPPDVSERPPTREELDVKVGEAQSKLAELKRAQEELQRERATLEEARRRRIELENGREELLQQLTRGVGILEEVEHDRRREVEQMAKSLADLRDALAKVQAIREEDWTHENWNTELTRALTTIENARMEWNSARLKWPLLDGASEEGTEGTKRGAAEAVLTLSQRGFAELCRLGLALTWPVALALAIGFALIILLFLPR